MVVLCTIKALRGCKLKNRACCNYYIRYSQEALGTYRFCARLRLYREHYKTYQILCYTTLRKPSSFLFLLYLNASR
jgi:hypothetical protein